MSDLRIDPRGVSLLLVDRDAPRRAALSRMLTEVGYANMIGCADPSTLSGSSEIEALDLAVLDLDSMQTTAGAVTDIRAMSDAANGLPIVGLLSDPTSDGRRRAVRLGVNDFAVRPVEAEELGQRIGNALAPGRLRRLLSDRSARLTEALRDHSAEAGTARESLSLLAAVADFHDDDTDLHAHRVGLLSGAIARALELPENFAAMLGEAAPLHDIGKVGISRRILLKPGSLTPPERIHMMQHADIGGQILAGAQSPVLVLAAEIARTHHERWDGSGYTNGLAEEQIPLSGRIVAVADVWDTLTHDRPYRAAWTPERALNEISDQAGAHFDPAVVEAFLSLEQEVLAPLGDTGARVA